ncbi:MAG: sulfite exporter TauE/SafE family protein [Dermatophilaceae bacterium]
MTWLAVPLGAAVGAILGVLGGGGAILTIPLLVYVLGQDPHEATTTSLVIVGISSAVAASRHWRRGAVDLRSALLLAALGARRHVCRVARVCPGGTPRAAGHARNPPRRRGSLSCFARRPRWLPAFQTLPTFQTLPSRCRAVSRPPRPAPASPTSSCWRSRWVR